MSKLQIICITLLALIAFAANSLITRFALEESLIDEASFTLLRIASGALFLWLFVITTKNKSTLQSSPTDEPKIAPSSGSWLAAFSLFIYAASFTYGYGLIAAGTGALLLFGSVQITMTIVGYLEGERLNRIQLLGFILALSGLVILMLPGISAPSLSGALLMCISGIAWGFYTLKGRAFNNPTTATTGNFLKATPMALVLWLVVYLSSSNSIHLAADGISYALLSGIVTSGIGYIIWYSVLPHLKANQAAIIQLSVPVLVTIMGAALLNEILTLRVIIASLTILFGTALVLTYKNK